MRNRWARLLAALRDPARAEGLRVHLANDSEASAELDQAIDRLTREGEQFLVETGQGMAAAWKRILDGVDAKAFTPGTELGRYAVLEHVGSGGMGAVYSAYDPQLDRKVALKVLHATGLEDQERLLREARALAQLDHPNIVSVYDVGTVGDRVFIAMEFVDGRSLREWADGQPWRAALDAFLAAGAGLAAAHAAGLVHRDFKPDNVLVTADRRARVVDFGLARADGRSPAEGLGGGAAAPHDPVSIADEVAPATDEEGTLEERLVGTPGYMAPEQLLERRFDARSDQFAFAVALWEVLYGERRFPGTDVEELAAAFRRNEPAAPPVSTSVPTRIRKILERATSVDPEARFASMAVLTRALADDPRERWTRRLVWATPGAAAAVALLWFVLQDPGAICRGAEGQLAGIWDTSTSEALRASLSESGHPRRDQIFERTRRALDRYGLGWVSARTSTCEATHVRGEQSEQLLDRRMTCLNRRRDELGALVAALSAGGADTADRAEHRQLATGRQRPQQLHWLERSRVRCSRSRRRRRPPPRGHHVRQEHPYGLPAGLYHLHSATNRIAAGIRGSDSEGRCCHRAGAMAGQAEKRHRLQADQNKAWDLV